MVDEALDPLEAPSPICTIVVDEQLRESLNLVFSALWSNRAPLAASPIRRLSSLTASTRFEEPEDSRYLLPRTEY